MVRVTLGHTISLRLYRSQKPTHDTLRTYFLMMSVLEGIWSMYIRATNRYGTAMRVARFIVSGSLATSANLGALFILTHFFDIWYLYSSIAATSLALVISFILQKVWTFENAMIEGVSFQVFLFLIVILTGLGINSVVVYTLVEYAGLHYLAAQVLSGLCIAVMNFFAYKHLVFRRPPVPLSAN